MSEPIHGFTYCECRVCEFTAIVRTVDRPELGFACPLCLEDNARVNIMSERPAVRGDKAELDQHAEAIIAINRSITENVRTHGQHVQGVGAGPGSPAFAYTIGNAAVGLPELLIIGNFPFPLMTMMLNAVGSHMRERGKPPEEGMLDLDWTFPFKIRKAGREAVTEYALLADDFLGRDDFSVLQVMICDPAGRYPGDAGCEERYDVRMP